MKDHFSRLRDRKGVHETKKKTADRRPLSEKEKVLKELIDTPHSVIIPTAAIRLDKRVKDAQKHNRSKERKNIKSQQIKKTHNFEQRLLEKERTRQKRNRRLSAAA